MNTIDWEIAWRDAQADSMFGRYPVTQDKWQKFWEEEAASFLKDVVANQEYYRSIVEYLAFENALRSADTVLDIACGPGTYSLLFAENAKQVESLDPSSHMLSTLMNEASRRNLINIFPIPSKWEDYSCVGKYDLVFSALSPVIKRPECLWEMERASRRTCCFVTYGPGGAPLLRKEIWAILTGEETGDDVFNITYPLNLLYSKGRTPNLRIIENESIVRIPTGKLVANNIRFFSLFVDINEDNKKDITDYIESRAQNGIFEATKKKSLAVLWWDVPR